MDPNPVTANCPHACRPFGLARAWARLALTLGFCLAGAPIAQADPGNASTLGLQAQVESLLKQQPLPHQAEPGREGAADTQARQADKTPPWRVEVSLGQLDPRIRLAPCDRVKAYLPGGAQLWGRTRVGLRCEQGPVRWNVYWPVQVKVWGQALVATVPLRPGSIVSASDVARAEVDLAASDSPALVRPTDIVGRAVQRSISPGQSLRQADVRSRRWFAAGDPVRLNVKGPGFMVAAEGVALAPGDEGRCARVRTEQGRVVCGQPVGERLVEVTL
ncbi:flagellar basal body P-ring formation chaperone FlgA [Aquabacterium parvum]|uniref:flagellar basal body P-ring formation chaperone FlgA n=1 Tax=Aquabacterium parvum TaxID=70584 RepID=UPI000718E3A3|nr:flagellar basal body P-ring formation chaperone FlgA [Aquabacterium parvum]MBU0916995.1 flagellar basal body P-ring formation chaperone FlgA [Gammaproteobacteria bacterium]